MRPVLFVFLVSLFIPLRVDVLTLSLYPSRLVLILVVVPLFVEWVRARDLKGRATDIIIMGHAVWAALGLAVIHGTLRLEAAGIYIIEVFGCYLIGRLTVRNPDQFRRVCKIIVIAVACTIPLAAFESFTDRNLLIDTLGQYTIEKIEHEIRLGLYRAQAVFPHPILYGVVAAAPLCLVYYVFGAGKKGLQKYIAGIIPVTAGFFSLSSAAFSLIVFQMISISYDIGTKNLKGKWKILGGLTALAYVVVDLISNRTPMQVFATRLSLNAGNAYARITQLHYAMDDVMRNWVFGIGFNPWDRPSWLVNSIDNFWLAIALRHGVITVLLLMIGTILTMREATSHELTDPTVKSYRTGYCILVITISIAIYTVHIWSEAFYFFLFFLGCRTWIAAGATEGPERKAVASRHMASSRRTRTPARAPVPAARQST